MDFQYKRGDKLILELVNTNEILEGEYVAGTKDRLTLINITSYKDSYLINGPYTYYRSDISSVRRLDKVEDNETSTTEKGNRISTDLILISRLEYERLKSMSRNYIYLTTMDSRYYKAIDHIKNHETIGLTGITTGYEETAVLSLLCFSTWDQVYLLDFLDLQNKKFPSELKEILECEHVRKVLHDSRVLTDVLAKRFNVKLTNVFDTKVADIAVRKKRGEHPQAVRSYSECLVNYFNFPDTLIAPEDKNIEKWSVRPLTDVRKYKASQKVTFLILLKNQLEDALLQEFYETVKTFSKSLEKCSMTEGTSILLQD